MTLTELLEAVKAAPEEQLPGIKLDLIAAMSVADARIANLPKPSKLEDDLTVKEAAAELNVHWKTAYKLAARKNDPLPTVKYGGARRVQRGPFEAWRKREAERGA